MPWVPTPNTLGLNTLGPNTLGPNTLDLNTLGPNKHDILWISLTLTILYELFYCIAWKTLPPLGFYLVIFIKSLCFGEQRNYDKNIFFCILI